MRVFAHHLYEYEKGPRRLVLHTTKAEYRDMIISKLERRHIACIRINDIAARGREWDLRLY